MNSFRVTYSLKGLERRTDYILRIYKRHGHEKGPWEFAVLKALKQNNMPVPAAYCLETDERIAGKPFIIMEWISGKSASHLLREEMEALVTVDKMAKTLAMIHKVDPNCLHHPELMQERQKFAQRKLLETKFLINNICMARLSPFRGSKYIRAVKQLEGIKTNGHFRPSILHGDFGPDHVLVQDGQFVVVDWEGASVGDPAYDVGWTYHALKLEGRMIIDHALIEANELDRVKVHLGEHFVECYENYAGEKLANLDFYKNLAAVKLALFFDEFLPPSIFWIFENLLSHRFKRMIKGALSIGNPSPFRNYCTKYLKTRGILL
jgi:aminoglycoside phosphotransferase (APT) family kinase protein